MIAIVNRTLNTQQRFSCVTRCRRFGKSMAAQMLCAYYDQSCDSRSLFADLMIAKDPSFEKHLNKYPVIYLDVTNFTARDIPRQEIVATIQQELKDEVCSLYPQVKVDEKDDLMVALTRIADHTHQPFSEVIQML